MARARLGLAKAVTDILVSRGADGKRISFRQAERITGLAPATISELAKGNARTTESVRRFAVGFNVDTDRLLLLAGFIPEDHEASAMMRSEERTAAMAVNINYDAAGHTRNSADDADVKQCLNRMGRALAMLPPGRERDLWTENLRRDTELIETFIARIPRDNRPAETPDE